MFTPKSKLLRNSSIGGTKASTSLNVTKRQSLYSSKPKSFFSPSSRNKSLNVTELPLEVDNGNSVENILTEFKINIPLSISETLIEAEKDSISGRILDSNWLIIVHNQKLFIWNLSYEDQLYNLPISYSTNCDLVVLDWFNRNHLTCFCVNRDGLCRYWNKLEAANNYCEIQLNLQLGEVCMSACAYAHNFLLIGTSQGRLFSIVTRSVTSLSYSLVKNGGGILSGISKRVSYYFGSENDESVQKTIQKLICNETGSINPKDVYVLTSVGLQKWSMLENGEKMAYNIMLVPLFESQARKHLVIDDDNDDDMNIILLDIIIMKPNITILAGISGKSANEANYALGFISLENNMPAEFIDFQFAKFSFPLLPGGHVAKFKCMHRESADTIYLYNKETIACVKLKEEKASEVVSLDNIAAGIHKNRAMFLSCEGILIQIEETRALANASVLENMSQRLQFSKIDTSILASVRRDNDAMMSSFMDSQEVADDDMAKFKNAFFLFMKNGPGDIELNSILRELFPPTSTGVSAIDSQLNQLVASFSLFLIDDRPASDPRWIQSLQPGRTPASLSLILMHQLNDKMMAHNLFTNFLQGTNLYNQLSGVRRNGSIIPNIVLLSEHAEKLVSAMALRELHLDMADIVDEAIEKCVGTRGWVTVPDHLTYQDLFYKEVSRIDEILAFLNIIEEEKLSENISSNDTAQLVLKINQIYLGILGKCGDYRLSNKLDVIGSMAEVHHIPWTVSSGNLGTKTAILKQISTSIETVSSISNDVATQHQIWVQIMQLTNHVLGGLHSTLSNQISPEASKSFESLRLELLTSLVNSNQFDHALFLAERYNDFNIIISVCCQNNDEDRIHGYFERLQDKGFAEAYFNWCISQGRQDKLFHPRYAGHPLLMTFLDRPQYKNFSWIYYSNNKLFGKAYKILLDLGKEETANITKKKTLLSLAKLNAILCKGINCQKDIDVIDTNLDLILHQEQLAENNVIMENLGLQSIEEMRVYSPVELIEIYIGHYNENSNALDFKKAIDLLRFCDEIDDEGKWRLILIDIWVKAIMRDSWTNRINTADIIASCSNKIVFELMTHLRDNGYDLEKFIPPIEELLDNELIDNSPELPTLQCQLMAMYEHLQRSVSM